MFLVGIVLNEPHIPNFAYGQVIWLLANPEEEILGGTGEVLYLLPHNDWFVE